MRNIPAALKAHLQQSVTTTCRLLKIELRDGSAYGLTSLDRDVIYDGVTYSAINGFNPSVIATDTSFDIDNSEGYALLSANVPGITADMVRRGDLDDAGWVMLLVNYEDLSQGHVILDKGDLGEVKLTTEDTVYIPELVSYAMRLRQTIGHVDSRLCRAIFGTPADSQTGCGVDVTALWENGSVTTIDDPYYSFGGFVTATNVLPGRLQWLTGDNASSRVYALESFEGGIVSLFERMPFPIKSGDTFKIRPDCDKSKKTCRDRWLNLINMKAEPDIPTSDGTAAQTPGATV